MDARTRYRRRLKVQAALTRVMELLATNVGDGIPPDPMTALMAWQVVGKLMPFIKESGLEPADLPDHSDISRFVHFKKARAKETAKRKRRRMRGRRAN